MIRAKRAVASMLAAALLATASGLASADVFVRGYFRSDGTYVRPHWRSDPDGNPYNNWSYKGNINPYTGKRGTKTYRHRRSSSPYLLQPYSGSIFSTDDDDDDDSGWGW